MENTCKRNSRLSLTESDLGKLKTVVQTAKRYLSGRGYIEVLIERLEDAEIVAPEKVPADIVEVDRTVRITDLDRSQHSIYKLVFPQDANCSDNISVITPLGSALLGSRVGEIIEVDAPKRTRKIRIDEIVARANNIAA